MVPHLSVVIIETICLDIEQDWQKEVDLSGENYGIRIDMPRNNHIDMRKIR